MIGGGDVYKVVAATVPLYVALALGLCSIRWWKMFTLDQSDAINRFVCIFSLPFLNLQFTTDINPYQMSVKFLGADFVAKAIIIVSLGLWAYFTPAGNYERFITAFSFCTMSNAIIVGVPMIKPMYGQIAVDLIVQAFVIQSVIWQSLLMFMFELRRVRLNSNNSTSDSELGDITTSMEKGTDSCSVQMNTVSMKNNRPDLWSLMKVIGVKLAKNPNSYACIVGLVWAFIAKRYEQRVCSAIYVEMISGAERIRWHFGMPSIIEQSMSIMSKTGTGVAMFGMGMSMALQKKLIVGETKQTIIGLVLRFIAAPLAMAVGCVAFGLHGDILRVAIIQAALPQAVVSFILAKEYELHPDVTSRAVILGTIVSLPVLIAYYALLQLIPS